LEGEKVSTPRDEPPFGNPVELSSGGLGEMMEPEGNDEVNAPGGRGEKLLRLPTPCNHGREIIRNLDWLAGKGHHAPLEAKSGLQGGTQVL